MESRQNTQFVLVIAAVGLITGLAGMSWLTGTVGVSAVTAQAIVKAVEVGSWGMFIVAIATTGGLLGAGLWAAVKVVLKELGTKAAIA